MSATFTNEGLQLINNSLGSFTGFANIGWKFELYRNNYTPLVTSVLADFTLPANTGYGAFTGIGWTTGVSAGGVNTVTFGPKTWNFNANILVETLYGWFFSVSISGVYKVVAANLLAAPFLIPPAPSSYVLTFSWTAQKLP